MVNVGVKLSDIGYQAAGTGKTVDTGVKGAQTDQFRKLLQGRQDESQDSGAAREVSRDTGQEKTEAPRKTEESKGKEPKDTEKDTKEDLKEDLKEEAVGEDSQTLGLLAAYQMAQGLRPELLTEEPEIVIEMPEAVQAVPEEAADMAVFAEMPEQMDVLAEAGAEETIDAVPVQTEVKPQEMVQTKEPEIQVKEPQTQVQEVNEPKVQAKAAEAVQAKEPETKAEPVKTLAEETPVVRREAVKTQSSEEEGQASTEEYPSGEQAAAPITQAPVKFAGQEVKPQEIVTVHVAQPEELPEKLTDQILTRMTEGVNSFEIEIEPENLGKIAVKILYEDGQATVSILCTEKKALDVLGNHAREIGGIIDRNMGGETKIYVEKQEPDYLNQNRDENQQGKQGEQEQQKEGNKKQQNSEDSEQFLQRLRLGLTM